MASSGDGTFTHVTAMESSGGLLTVTYEARKITIIICITMDINNESRLLLRSFRTSIYLLSDPDPKLKFQAISHVARK